MWQSAWSGRRLGAAIRCRPVPRPAHGAHLAAGSAAAEEPVAAVGLEPRHADVGRHLELLQDLARFRIDPPQLALVVFPGAVPQLALDPGDAGDEAVGLDRAKNRPPRASLRPTSAPSHRRRRAPGSWRARGRSWDRSSGCASRRSGTGAGRRTPFPHARRRRSCARSCRFRDRRR